MVRQPESEIPGLLQSLPTALTVLRRSLDELLESFWDETCRSRMCEQSGALAQASKLQGLIRVFTLSRAMASICFISREEALPIRTEVAEKLHELMDLLDEACGETLGEQTG